ncbi:hypothetical protein CERSUDRAFT_118036 [Gelatoporia subvermispora B]|uniref:Uncharacterized protein n=1 Tax=Ceriporiopsis subvermispora (strain B) TaxID=914234 RepID=M2R3F8_CERS8|nr:hypothetical protein CERSUDRAFT_118036 [Gelatoporia subvermispora B]
MYDMHVHSMIDWRGCGEIRTVNKSIRGATPPPTWLQMPGTRPAGTINLSSGGAAHRVELLGATTTYHACLCVACISQNVIIARRVLTDDTDHTRGGLLYQPIAILDVVQCVDWMRRMCQRPGMSSH